MSTTLIPGTNIAAITKTAPLFAPHSHDMSIYGIGVNIFGENSIGWVGTLSVEIPRADEDSAPGTWVSLGSMGSITLNASTHYAIGHNSNAGGLPNIAGFWHYGIPEKFRFSVDRSAGSMDIFFRTEWLY